jgi:hypothetical protein
VLRHEPTIQAILEELLLLLETPTTLATLARRQVILIPLSPGERLMLRRVEEPLLAILLRKPELRLKLRLQEEPRTPVTTRR